MEAFDSAAEMLRLAEHYRRMSDDELLELAKRASDLTDCAKLTLNQEILVRKLQIEESKNELSSESLATDDSTDVSSYAEERELVELCPVWGRTDALNIQNR